MAMVQPIFAANPLRRASSVQRKGQRQCGGRKSGFFEMAVQPGTNKCQPMRDGGILYGDPNPAAPTTIVTWLPLGRKSSGQFFAGLIEIPAVLPVEIGVEFVGAIQRPFHRRCLARCSRKARSAISRNSPSRIGACGPFTAFNNSTSNSGLSFSQVQRCARFQSHALVAVGEHNRLAAARLSDQPAKLTFRLANGNRFHGVTLMLRLEPASGLSVFQLPKNFWISLMTSTKRSTSALVL